MKAMDMNAAGTAAMDLARRIIVQPDTLGDGDCEAQHAGFLGQPTNTISSLGYVAGGVWLLTRIGRIERGERIVAVGYAVSVAMAGAGSVAYHGPQFPGAQLLHDLPIIAMVGIGSGVPAIRMVRPRAGTRTRRSLACARCRWPRDRCRPRVLGRPYRFGIVSTRVHPAAARTLASRHSGRGDAVGYGLVAHRRARGRRSGSTGGAGGHQHRGSVRKPVRECAMTDTATAGSWRNHMAQARIVAAIARLTWREVDSNDISPTAQGPVLLVANHFGGAADAIVLMSVLPRRPRILADDSIWRFPVARQVMEWLGAVPVHRGRGARPAGTTPTCSPPATRPWRRASWC